MAQTKTKTKTKTRSKSKASSSKSKGSQQSSRARPKKARTSSRKSSKSGGTQGRKPTQSSRRSSSNSGGSPLDKLKGPATATGAALLAVAGGLAATRARNGNGRRRKLVKSLKGIDLPSADTAIDWVEKRATDVGDAADKAEQMTSTVRKLKKALS
jgi:hypothetical protein